MFTHCKQDMAKAVFTTKVEPTCDDLPEFRYHFPRSYLRQAEAAVGDQSADFESVPHGDRLSAQVAAGSLSRENDGRTRDRSCAATIDEAAANFHGIHLQKHHIGVY